jgi:hypothetical protein
MDLYNSKKAVRLRLVKWALEKKTSSNKMSRTLVMGIESLTHMRSRTHHVRSTGVAATLVSLHVAAHAESLTAPNVRALERLLPSV